MDAIFHALSDPTRRRILELLREQELKAGVIAQRFAMTRPAISQHLKVLSQAGLVAIRTQGTSRYYRLRREALAALRIYLAAFWDERLAALKAAVETSATDDTSR